MGCHGRQHQLPAQLLHRRSQRWRAAPSIIRPSTGSAATTMPCSGPTPPSPALTPAGTRSAVSTAAPPPRRPCWPGIAPTAWPTAGPRWVPHHFHITLAAGEKKSIIFGLGYIENPQEEKFVAPGVINKTRARAMMARYATDAQVDEARRALTDYWDRSAAPAGSWTPARRSWTGWSTSGTSTSAWSRST